jgi:hypothetical protein
MGRVKLVLALQFRRCWSQRNESNPMEGQASAPAHGKRGCNQTFTLMTVLG